MVREMCNSLLSGCCAVFAHVSFKKRDKKNCQDFVYNLESNEKTKLVGVDSSFSKKNWF